MLTTVAGKYVFVCLTHDEVRKASTDSAVMLDGKIIGCDGKTFVLMFGESHEEMADRLNRTADDIEEKRGKK